MEKIVQVDNNRRRTRGALRRAADIILSGGVVAYPTESFYGLAVNIENDSAIKKLYEIKKREADKPILILIPSAEDLRTYVEETPEAACKLIEAFWPGGLTILFRSAMSVSPLLTAGTGKIGIRLSSHPVASGLARAVGKAITGTSANISGQPPCQDARQVEKTIGRAVDLILDGGATQGGGGSTIIDVTVSPSVILRQGIVGRQEIEKVLGKSLAAA
ncbi:MAG: threonylcarbamoyl-AMP synthase [Deltaproteobacteria bacterium]|nr:threonylcarbamoyl-AMP synthase [Deltaproteobacteria bacterium]MBW2137147.1 threonylcarbamoyl-AMP synthase [Deltaproteobacteria bacterium]